jgi:hypothetical protein
MPKRIVILKKWGSLQLVISAYSAPDKETHLKVAMEFRLETLR